jgi:hypothetical protein
MSNLFCLATENKNKAAVKKRKAVCDLSEICFVADLVNGVFAYSLDRGDAEDYILGELDSNSPNDGGGDGGEDFFGIFTFAEVIEKDMTTLEKLIKILEANPV